MIVSDNGNNNLFWFFPLPTMHKYGRYQHGTIYTIYQNILTTYPVACVLSSPQKWILLGLGDFRGDNNKDATG